MSLEKVSASMQALGVAYFFWIGYGAPTSQQATKDFLVAAFLLTSLILLLVKLFRHPQEEKEQSKPAPPDSAINQTETDKEKILPFPSPDTSLRDWDPKIELELTDDRANYGGNRPNEMIWFTPVNRGGGDAKIVRLDDVRLQGTGYTITCASSGYRIAPHRQGEILFKIRQPDDCLEMTLDLFDVLWREYEALHDPMRRDLPIPLKVSYQDEMRNLFVTDCDLVFDPRAYINKTLPIARVQNKSFARVALAASLLEAVKTKSR